MNSFDIDEPFMDAEFDIDMDLPDDNFWDITEMCAELFQTENPF